MGIQNADPACERGGKGRSDRGILEVNYAANPGQDHVFGRLNAFLNFVYGTGWKAYKKGGLCCPERIFPGDAEEESGKDGPVR